LVSIKTGLSLGLLAAGALAFFALGGAKGIGQRIGSGFTGFGQSLADSFKFPEFVVEKSGGIQYDEKVLKGQSFEIPNYPSASGGTTTLIIPPGEVTNGIFRSDKPPMTKEYEEWLDQQVPNVDLPDTTSTPSNPYPRAPSLQDLFPRLAASPTSQTSTPAIYEPQVFDKPQSQLQALFDSSAAAKLSRPGIKPIGTSITGGEFYGWGSETGGGI
jgi:hypothetical protein